MQKKKMTLLIVVLALLSVVWYSNPILKYHNVSLKRAVTNLQAQEITLNEVVPFGWDAVYTFPPYMTREAIEAEIGIHSRSIPQTVSEGQVQLIFVKGTQIVTSVCAYPKEVGYNIEFDGKITYAEKAAFTVSNEAGIVHLTCKTA